MLAVLVLFSVFSILAYSSEQLPSTTGGRPYRRPKPSGLGRYVVAARIRHVPLSMAWWQALGRPVEYSPDAIAPPLPAFLPLYQRAATRGRWG